MHKDVKLHSKHEDKITWWDPNKKGTTNNWWLKMEVGSYEPIAKWKWCRYNHTKLFQTIQCFEA